ncbi:MAG: neutral/alkaline non-lysosomal ceramidase N-terminal domain-containing protein [bacterium]|nr:neutral/alkaline non-lysosomal ceramidase N-terminal domain-containing protein [bacterium]
MSHRLYVLLVLLWPSPLAAGEFRAGAAVGDITPTQWPVNLVGTFAERPAEKAWDPLSARALVLDDGQTQLAIVIIDSCMLPRDLLDEVKRQASQATGIRSDHMLMAATHTHSAPASLDRMYAQASPAYLQVLRQGIVQAVTQAQTNLEAAEIGCAQFDLPEHVHNRRWFMKPGGMVQNPFGELTDQVRMNPPRGTGLLDRPAGPVDPQVSLVSVRSQSGLPIALLANYSLHYVGGVPPGGVSADYFGEFARQIASRIDPQQQREPAFVGILSNGTSGDVNNIDFRNPQPRKEPFEQIRYVATSLADAAHQAYTQTSFSDSISLSMAQRELTLEVRKPTPQQLERAKEFLAEEDESVLPARGKAYAEFTLQLQAMPATENILLQAVRIGDIGIAAIPCEVFAEIGLELKQRSPLEKTFTIELANGWNRYLPTPQQHRLGGYETWMGTNMLEINASDKIQKVLLELFNEVLPAEQIQSTAVPALNVP